MPRIPKPTGKSRHDPLHIDIAADDIYAKYGNISKPGRRQKSRHSKEDDDQDGGGDILDVKTSKRIFELARDQQDEFDLPDNRDEDVIEDEFTRPRTREEVDDDDEDDEEEFRGFPSDDERELEIDESDIQALDALHSSNAAERKTLADIIFSKLESITGQAAGSKRSPGDEEPPDPAEGLDPKVVEVYTKCGWPALKQLSCRTVAQTVQIIPSLPAWARILALTTPEQWSPQATHAATRIFISNMKPPQARVYLEGVVLGLVRANLEQPSTRKDARKLSPHLYEALKRALYKPAAFFKGIIFPLLDGGCTLKEAAIVASVLAKVKVPLLHSSAALIHLAGMDYSGTAHIALHPGVADKKHALPYKVLDALVFHFVRLARTHEAGTLPVLWHQSLLVLCQRYAGHLAPEQKDALRDVVRLHAHAQIASEVRRELAAAPARGVPHASDDDMDVS
ncbi:Bystin-domain-containing protein [Multifurca ochricompacta]|uniref:Bystin-domain-containing protein n=1 Tax=Multifurca ochricompacta TaxID=376703 RepID=A0AAD4M3D6_9AGAM|nr:Bystin-domain-containing protein [Multifurca ochricompacta]